MQEEENKAKDAAVTTIKGTFWRSISHFSGKLMVFVTTVVLARFLSKEDFGVAGYAIVVIGFLDVLSDLGVGMAVIYYSERKSRSNTAFWLNLIIGFALLGITWVVAPYAALFFHDPRAINVIRTLGWFFPLDALSNIHDCLLQKDLAFGRKLIPDFFRSVCKGVISIILAVLGYGAYSLIYGQLLGTAVSVIAYWWINPFRPSFEFKTKHVRSLLSYGLGIVAVNGMGVAILNVDYLLVGRYLGPIALGVYTLSFRVPELLVKQFCAIIGKVLFPLYARMRSDASVLSEGFLTTMRYVTMVTFPVSIGLALVTRPFVLTVFSAKWADAIPVIPAISIYTLIRSLTFNIGDMYKAQGRLRLLNKISILQLSMLVPALYYAVTHFQSIAAVGWTQVVVVTIGGFIRFYIAVRLLNTPLREFARAVEPAVMSTVLMSIAVVATMLLLPDRAPALELIVSSATGALVYVASLWSFRREVVLTAANTLRMAFARR